ncbi:MAG: redoxin domain-containing protein [Nitrospirae bacterium]|nr:redoxin domain-containing protein [Nitrospirota bacterium]
MTMLKIGDAAPDFPLPATDGKIYRLADFGGKTALVVVFSCHHCPYVQGRSTITGNALRP